jgi:hypothetical protein
MRQRKFPKSRNAFFVRRDVRRKSCPPSSGRRQPRVPPAAGNLLLLPRRKPRQPPPLQPPELSPDAACRRAPPPCAADRRCASPACCTSWAAEPRSTPVSCNDEVARSNFRCSRRYPGTQSLDLRHLLLPIFIPSCVRCVVFLLLSLACVVLLLAWCCSLSPICTMWCCCSTLSCSLPGPCYDAFNILVMLRFGLVDVPPLGHCDAQVWCTQPKEYTKKLRLVIVFGALYMFDDMSTQTEQLFWVFDVPLFVWEHE